MKKILLLLFLFSSHAFSAPKLYSLQFSEIVFPDLLQAVYSEIFNHSYVIDTNVLQSSDLLTMHIKDKSAGDIEQYILALLDARGLSVVKKSSIDIITKKPDSANTIKEIFLYRPRFRSASYLVDVLSVFFSRDRFTTFQVAQVPNSLDTQNANFSGSSLPLSTSAPVSVPVVQNSPGPGSYSQNSVKDLVSFFGEPYEIKRLETLLSQLDNSAVEMLIRAMVYEVRAEQNEGSASSIVASLLAGKFNLAIDGGAVLTNALKMNFGNFDAVYSLLSGDKRFKLISSPFLRVTSGASARFVVGNEVPILGAVTYPGNGSQAVQAVEYKPSGVILNLKPHAREDVTDLDIFQQISSFVPTSNGVNQSPTLLKRELQTQVTVKSDELIVLSGLEET